MNPVPRSPVTCNFRRIDDIGDQPRITCRLVSAIAGDDASAARAIDETVCDACCRHPLPSGARLNPVVASLVYSFATQARQRKLPSVAEQVRIHQARLFAMRWLALLDTDRQSADQREPNGLSESLATRNRRATVAWRGGEGEQPLCIGLVGRHGGFGLGHQNRDIAAHLGVDRWLVRGCGETPPHCPSCRMDEMSRDLSPIELEAWLDGLDAVLFVESPVFSALTKVARQIGVLVVCVPNWEWLHPGLDWLDHVNLMLCPTWHTANLLSRWKQRFQFGWAVDCVPWPVDTDRFEYRPRPICRRFVYVDGSGGVQPFGLDGSSAGGRRKGLDVLLAAAWLAPEIPLVVYALRHDISPLPPNVELRPPPADNTLLYCEGDVCVQPSRWEGLGLPLLECQAAGMPLVTTDAPPMSEHRPLAVIPTEQDAVFLTPELCIPAARIQPDDLADVLRSLHGRRIGAPSRRARRFVEREHSWGVARPRILRSIRGSLSAGV